MLGGGEEKFCSVKERTRKGKRRRKEEGEIGRFVPQGCHLNCTSFIQVSKNAI
jgi:hypothetical protein